MTDSIPDMNENSEGTSVISEGTVKGSQKEKRKLRKSLKWILGLLVIGTLVFGGFYFGTHYKKISDAQKMGGGIALSAGQLRDVVVANHLAVYWTGAVKGDKYSLYVPKTGVAVVRYLPKGAKITDTAPKYRLIATYTLKNAFSVTKTAGATLGNLAYITVDGNAAFYARTRPTNVYVGIKGADFQIQIFDPDQDQAVALSLLKGQIQKIR